MQKQFTNHEITPVRRPFVIIIPATSNAIPRKILQSMSGCNEQKRVSKGGLPAAFIALATACKLGTLSNKARSRLTYKLL